jgi:hypothetical protein
MAPRPRLTKSHRQSLRDVVLASSEDEENENAEQSEERQTRPKGAVPRMDLDKLPVATLTRTTSYMPGSSSALVSPSLSVKIQSALIDSVTVLVRQVGSVRLECFSGANVVNCLLRLKFADHREEATALATRVYSDGMLRALQPGGFIDHVEYVYRFQDSVVGEEQSEPSDLHEQVEAAAAVEQPRPCKVIPRDDMLFSIAKIVGGRNEDWLNNSFGFVDANAMDHHSTALESTECEDSFC